jgi:hypothetical protein
MWRIDAAAQSTQEGLELSQLLRTQFQRPEFRVTSRSSRCLIVVIEDFTKGSKLAGVHVRSALSDASKRRNFERALQLVTVRLQELELGALRGRCVTPAAPAVELVGQNVLRSLATSPVLRH